MKLQMKYNLLHISFWAAYCALYGYVAVFLQSKGMSNSLIGVVTGVGAVSTIVISPMISGLVGKSKLFTNKSLLLYMSVMMMAFWGAMAFIPLPITIIMIMYMVVICLMVSCVPFLSTICMDYLRGGDYLNFGVSRGMGSVAYATSAVVLGPVIEMFSPNVLAVAFWITDAIFLSILFSMKDPNPPTNPIIKKEGEKKDSIFSVIKQYPTYFFTLLGFGICFAASSGLAVYLINIVKNLGGSTSLYGIAVFCMAASEMPFMGLTRTLMKKFKAEQLLLFAALMYICRNFLICLAPAIPILLIGMMFQGASYGLFTGVITYYVSDYLREDHQIMGQTLIAMMTTGFGSTIGNVFGGILQDAFGLQMMLICAMGCTLVGTVIAVMTQLKVLKSKG